MNSINNLLIHILILTLILTFTGCNSTDEESTDTIVETPSDKPSDDARNDFHTVSSMTVEEKIEYRISDMTLEEKIAGLFIVDLYGMTGQYHLTSVNENIKAFIDHYPVSGVVLFAENIETRDQVVSFIDHLQSESASPLFIAIDEEGGLVSRLGKADIGVTHLDKAADLALNYASQEVYELSHSLGKEMAELGFNFDFAPVLDVNSNPENPIIGTRSFSADPLVASEYGNAFSSGLNDAKIISSGKHFPGHGDTQTDSHLGLASISASKEELYAQELVPFIEAIESGIPAIMVGHITVPSLDQNNPATLSVEIMTGLLRKELGYDGVVVSDSFRMQAITDFYSASKVGVLFIQAGGDLILIPDDFQEVYKGLYDAVVSGEISEERINESVRRILQLKYAYSILN